MASLVWLRNCWGSEKKTLEKVRQEPLEGGVVMRKEESGGQSGKEQVFSKPLTTGQVARHCHVSRVTVCNWIRAGKLEAYRLPGGHHRITPEAFRAFVERYSIPVSRD